MSTLKCGVVGAGYLGKFHAAKYAEAADCELVAVCDIETPARRRVAEACATRPVADYRQLLGELDAVSIATPTPSHHRIARDFLQSGAHVLLEKPMTVSLEEADELIELADSRRRLLQIGHIERFNPALLELGDALLDPMFIDSARLTPFNERDQGVSVILDLMIHDLDIILSLTRSEIADIRASGVRVLTDDVDIANARIEFENGCVANITASHISGKAERSLRLFKQDCYYSIDLHNCSYVIRRRNPGRNIEQRERQARGGDALRAEIEHFLGCIRNAQAPLVGGREGRRALDAAIRVARALRR